MYCRSKQAIMIFIKNPVLGGVKTRLAKTTGKQFALRFYHFLLENTRQLSREFQDADKFLFYDRFIPAIDDWPEEVFYKDLQRGSCMHEKIDNAFEQLFRLDYDKVCWLVPDCPSLKYGHLRSGFEALDQHHVVLGPTIDGGIYLLGMQKHIKSLLIGRRWGNGTVYRDLARACNEQGLQFAKLSALQDIDREKDLCYVPASLKELAGIEGGYADLA